MNPRFLSLLRQAKFPLVVAIVCLFLFSGCDSNKQHQTIERNVTVTMLLPRSYDLKNQLTQHLSTLGDVLTLADGTNISLSLTEEDDLSGRARVISGSLKPHLWLTLHPSLADVANTSRSTLAISQFTCTPVAETNLEAIGAPFETAKQIQVINPAISLMGLFAVAAAPESISRFLTFPTGKILTEAPQAEDEVRVIDEELFATNAPSSTSDSLKVPLPRRSMPEKFFLSACQARSDLFSAREIFAAELVKSLIEKMSFSGFSPLTSIPDPKLNISALLETWRTRRTQPKYTLVIDASDSMLGKNLSYMEAIASKLISSVKTPNTVRVISYNRSVTVHDTTMSPSNIIRGLSFAPGGNLVEALDAALKLNTGEPMNILVFADDIDGANAKAIEGKLSSPPYRNVQVYGFSYGEASHQQLLRYTKLSGGTTVAADSIDSALSLVEALAL